MLAVAYIRQGLRRLRHWQLSVSPVVSQSSLTSQMKTSRINGAHNGVPSKIKKTIFYLQGTNHWYKSNHFNTGKERKHEAQNIWYTGMVPTNIRIEIPWLFPKHIQISLTNFNAIATLVHFVSTYNLRQVLFFFVVRSGQCFTPICVNFTVNNCPRPEWSVKY